MEQSAPAKISLNFKRVTSKQAQEMSAATLGAEEPPDLKAWLTPEEKKTLKKCEDEFQKIKDTLDGMRSDAQEKPQSSGVRKWFGFGAIRDALLGTSAAQEMNIHTMNRDAIHCIKTRDSIMETALTRAIAQRAAAP